MVLEDLKFDHPGGMGILILFSPSFFEGNYKSELNKPLKKHSTFLVDIQIP